MVAKGGLLDSERPAPTNGAQPVSVAAKLPVPEPDDPALRKW
jgi:hypothetical protein